MTAAAVMAETQDLQRVSELLEQLLRRRAYATTDVLTLEEFCAAVKIGRTKLFKVLPKLPVSYALGSQSPRIIWGDFLDYLRETRID